MIKIALIGRTNAGKSTLLNNFTNQMVAAVSKKIHTTQIPQSGIWKENEQYWILFDTPGLCIPKNLLDKIMFLNLKKVLMESDLIWFVIDIDEFWGKDMQILSDLIKKESKPTILVINKTDKANKIKILQKIEKWKEKTNLITIVPISATKKHNFYNLIQATKTQILDLNKKKNQKLLVSNDAQIIRELIREQIMNHTNDEIPYQTALELIHFKEHKNLIRVSFHLLVSTNSQKIILIGKQGKKIHQIQSQSEKKISFIKQKKVILSLFVKVEPKWYKNTKIIKKLDLEWNQDKEND